MRNSIIAALIFITVVLVASVTGGGEVPHLSGRSVFKNLSRGDVMFPHERHYDWGIGCLSCHHRYEKGSNVLTIEELQQGTQAVSCASCHSSGRDIERAYHHLCITCHQDMKKNSISSGPVICGRCHSKKGR